MNSSTEALVLFSISALVGEIGFQATYKFRPNLMARAAWDFMWITGVALAPDGEPGLNALCPAYRAFFRHSRPGLQRLARHMKQGRTLRSFI